jgi:hypothetical protein
MPAFISVCHLGDEAVGAQCEILADLPGILGDRPLSLHAGEPRGPLRERVRGDDVSDDRGSGGSVLHQPLRVREPIVGDEVLAFDHPAELRPVAARLEHREHQPPVVRRLVVADDRVGRRGLARPAR